MNLMSAPTYCTRDKSDALSAVMTWLGSPGAPGWTIGGFGSATVAAPAPGAAVRHDAAATAHSRIAAAPQGPIVMTSKDTGSAHSPLLRPFVPLYSPLPARPHDRVTPA